MTALRNGRRSALLGHPHSASKAGRSGLAAVRDERNETREAIALLRIFHHARGVQGREVWPRGRPAAPPDR